MNTKRNIQTNPTHLQSLLKWFSLILMAISIMSLPSVVSADEPEAGKIIFIFGQAWKHATDGGKRDLKRGMVVRVGETIETSSNGQVQIRMNDNGLIAIRPGSQFKIQAFKFSGVEGAGSSDDKSYFQLLKGGFRSITGAVGQRNKQAYRVTTPVATIGIRGTDYTARLCSADCLQADGLYIGVWQGGVSLSNETGVADIDAGQFGFVADANTSPASVNSVPAGLLVASSGQIEASQGQQTTASAAGTDVTELLLLASADTVPEPTSLSDVIVEEIVVVTPTISLPSTGTATYSMASVTGSNTTTGATFVTGTTANLTANFVNPTVDADVNISLSDGANWDGAATGMALNTDGSFSGAMTGSSTTLLDSSTTSGTFSGGLTGLGDGTIPTGATLDVSMQSDFPLDGSQTLDASFTLQ
ncbi:MAG: FecR family protein [Gammaproteobacteria bacterium]|nr:FecR family protein [Gammaproteobacteria bacterium]